MATQARNAGTRKETKKTKAQILKERRKIREDLGSDRNVMTTPKIPGMVVRWVNDELKSGQRRVDALKRIGYTVYDGEAIDITPPNGVTEANLSQGNGAMIAVGLDRENKPMHAILMMIPQDIYDADQELKMEAIQKQEDEMLSQGDGQPGMYGGIRIGNA